MTNWKYMSVSTKIMSILAALLLISITGGVTTIWHANRMQNFFLKVMDKDVTALSAAQELQTALAAQKGFVTYYFLYGDEDWLRQLDERRRDLDFWLQKARETSTTPEEVELIGRIQSKYAQYTSTRDRIIEMYRKGERKKGEELHKNARQEFFDIYDLCEQYKQIQVRGIALSRDQSRKDVKRVTLLAVSAMSAVLLVSLLLAFILATRILAPIKELAREAGRPDKDFSEDEVTALSTSVHGLIEDRDQTRSELVKSRALLLSAEKMAAVGKLAAGVAHSIRNPLTSVKMRLFSLERSLNLSESQQDDFSVISQEIRNVDNIVQNFLEFSRPPRLRMQQVSPSDVIDGAIVLLRHRLELLNIKVEIKRKKKLPRIKADPELLKEVMVNLLNNACDAMEENGAITIIEDEAAAEQMGRAVLIKIMDTGPGVSEQLIDQLFEPFFSTKEEGTGLGLSIARRIIQEHDGELSVRSKEGEGAAFIITLPAMEEDT